MKLIAHKIMSIVMVFVVLFSTMSFTINAHYCGGTLVETAIFQKAKGCGMEIQKPSTEGCSISKKSCCKDEQSLVNGQNELQHNVDSLSLEQQVLISSIIYNYSNLFEGSDKEVVTFDLYKPPIVIRQLFKLDETYLI